MEKKNKRYIEIDTCMKCEYNGHISSWNKEEVIFICSNQNHMNLDIPKGLIDKTAYPIVSKEKRNVAHSVPIPSWCTLPKEVVS